MSSIEEIKKAIYQQNPKAKLGTVNKSGIYYASWVKMYGEEEPLRFFIPLSDMGDASFEYEMPAKFLIRWLLTDQTNNT